MPRVRCPCAAGDEGTMNRTGLAGQSCAWARSAVSAAARKSPIRFIGLLSSRPWRRHAIERTTRRRRAAPLRSSPTQARCRHRRSSPPPPPASRTAEHRGRTRRGEEIRAHGGGIDAAALGELSANPRRPPRPSAPAASLLTVTPVPADVSASPRANGELPRSWSCRSGSSRLESAGPIRSRRRRSVPSWRIACRRRSGARA